MKNHLKKVSAILALFWASAAFASPLLTGVSVGSQSPTSINPGSNATYSVTVTRSGTGNIDIYLACSGLPAGATASFSPSVVHFSGSTPTTGSATLTVSTTPSIAQGSYNFTVTAQDGGSHNTVTNTGTLLIGSDGKTTLTSQNITSIQVLPDGSASIALHAAPSKSYILQASQTLSPSAWVNISTNTTDITGDCILLDSSASAYPSRFYRTTVLN